MPISPEVDKRIRERFEYLESESDCLLSTYIEQQAQDPGISMLMRMQSGIPESGIRYEVKLQSLKTNFINLLQALSSKQHSFGDLIKRVNSLDAAELHGTILGLKSDYENGMLRSVAEMIEANIVADYLTQAEQLLKVNKRGQYNHVPAAVLAGAVLEDGLRRLCARQSPPIAVRKPGGSYKMLNALIDDLKSAELFNELKAKQLRAWVDIRNAAAHGQFDDFTRSDVEQMLAGIQNFLADYL